MQILLIGGGGREHALAWKMAASPLVGKVWVAPGNAGTASEPRCENVPIAATDTNALLQFALNNHIDLTVVGPETPLANGVVDVFQKAQLPCFGPTKKAAQLESSKAFCKDFFKKYHIPTAEYQVFHTAQEAQAYVMNQPLPIVIKASQLAGGKGVVIAKTLKEAFDTITHFLDGSLLGAPTPTLVIERFLTGREVSFIALVDGEHVLPLATSQDHKTRDNGDQGPNTGGMGAYSPVPWVTPALEEAILQQVMIPTVRGMQQEGSPFVGFLYAGLMIDAKHRISVLEFNCRLGDPETQPILMRLKSDLVPLLLSALHQTLHLDHLEWDPSPAIGVILAARGYPGPTVQGKRITLPLSTPKTCKIFHAGTQVQDNSLVTQGGRVLCVTALGKTLQDAQETAYKTAQHIDFEGKFYRTDIGWQEGKSC